MWDFPTPASTIPSRTFLYILYFLADCACINVEVFFFFLRCQDQCWPQINNFLGTCTLQPPIDQDTSISLILLFLFLLFSLVQSIFSQCEIDRHLIPLTVHLKTATHLLSLYQALTFLLKRGHTFSLKTVQLSFPQQLMALELSMQSAHTAQ